MLLNRREIVICCRITGLGVARALSAAVSRGAVVYDNGRWEEVEPTHRAWWQRAWPVTLVRRAHELIS